LVELRNQSLATFAAESLGEATGKVYHVLLELLTAQLPKCQWDSSLQESAPTQVAVTTLEIYDSLGEDVVLGGIGKAPKEKVDYNSAEKIRALPPDSDNEYDDSDTELPARGRSVRVIESEEEEESFSDSEDEAPTKVHDGRPAGVNGGGQPRVKFEDGGISKDNRLDKMRQHLLLLAESKHKFVRHCGVVGRGQWTVDFEQLLAQLRESEIDAFIEQSFGRHGLRLTRILREKGKLDEKMLHTAALMRKSDVQGKMLAMQMAGIVDIQEVPKDNMRLANRTMFFWFFDSDKTRSHLLDDVYKAMLRCLQTLQVERYKERNILSFVDRKDVQGKEEEVMTPEHYNKYNRHLEIQEKLLGQVMRLDDTVGIFRDY
jgi:DNA-directed RNA polymerase III subunit RPC3